jgi:hypothetical protein
MFATTPSRNDGGKHISAAMWQWQSMGPLVSFTYSTLSDYLDNVGYMLCADESIDTAEGVDAGVLLNEVHNAHQPDGVHAEIAV